MVAGLKFKSEEGRQQMTEYTKEWRKYIELPMPVWYQDDFPYSERLTGEADQIVSGMFPECLERTSIKNNVNGYAVVWTPFVFLPNHVSHDSPEDSTTKQASDQPNLKTTAVFPWQPMYWDYEITRGVDQWQNHHFPMAGQSY